MSDENTQSNETENPAHRAEPGEMLRRTFLSGISLGLCGWAAFIVGIPIIGFLVAPIFKEAPRLWRSVGPVNKFKVGDTVEVTYEDVAALKWAGLTGKTAAWLRRTGDQEFVAFSVNCSHLGCPVRWMPTAQLFMCPCHGGIYYANGNVAAGPPPRGLTRYPVRVYNGDVEILTSPAPIT
ncbi:MAG TPA: Rieske (2Fe-2S) protein [Terriglobia bacterium]|nr:Rieske (2Fe-2S) protein [Terriglobia bacterium]